MKKKIFFNADQFWFTFPSYSENFSSIGLLWVGAEIFIFDFLKIILQNCPQEPPTQNFWKFLFCQNLIQEKSRTLRVVYLNFFWEHCKKDWGGADLAPPHSAFIGLMVDWIISYWYIQKTMLRTKTVRKTGF